MGLKLVKYDREKHLMILKDWRASWPIGEYPWDSLPEHGWLCFDGDKPLCCGFLRLAEGGVAMTDCILSDPTQDPETRKKITEGLNLGTQAMNEFLKERGIRALWIWTQRDSMVKRCLENFPGSVAFPAFIIARLDKDV